MKRLCLFLLFLMFPLSTFADAVHPTSEGVKEATKEKHKEHHHQAKKEDPWDGTKAGLGVARNTGNSNSTSINTDLTIDYTKYHWNDVAQLSYNYGRAEGTLNKDRYFAQNQLQYSFSADRKHPYYLFNIGSFTADHFSPYIYQWIAAVGLGKELYHSSRFKVLVQAGPGARSDKERTNGDVDYDAIVTSELTVNWNVSTFGVLSEVLRYDYGRRFSYTKSVTEFTNKVTKRIAIQLKYIVSYYSTIPEGATQTDRLDTITTIALVYNF